MGVDMTPEQLAVAERHRDYHRQAFGHATSNVTFLQRYIEQLDQPMPRHAAERGGLPNLAFLSWPAAA